jgi:uncharacterized membrane protein
MKASDLVSRLRKKDEVEAPRRLVKGARKEGRSTVPVRGRADLSAPRRRGINLGIHYDPEAFGRFSEGIARFIGTARFLVYQSIFIALWIIHNKFAPERFRIEEFPFAFLTLILSLQAAYAAPLILLAQNRQELRDRRQNERDRGVASRTQADAEYITRELASIRLGLADVATVEEVEKAFEKALGKALEKFEKANKPEKIEKQAT